MTGAVPLWDDRNVNARFSLEQFGASCSCVAAAEVP